MNHLIHHDPFDDLLRGFFVRPVDMGATSKSPSLQLDIRESTGNYLVHAELPGIRKEDIHVQIDGDLVTLSAERKQEQDSRNGEHILRSERYFGKVSRTIRLGQDIDESQSVARFTDGVLELTLPKKVAAGARRLTIE